MPITPHPTQKRSSESGFTMVSAVLAMSIVVLLGAVGVVAVNGDNRLTTRDLEAKQAFEAAKAGIDDYAYHLSSNTGYWAECTNGPTPNAVNQLGSTAKKRPVPGNTGATYALELIPATGQSSCNPSTIETATRSMIESGETLPGSFRIRSTGFSGKAKQSIVATFKPPSFLDYVYFTQLETLDPITFGYEPGSSALTAAYKQCELTWQQGRYDKPFEWTVYNQSQRRWETFSENCVKISFATGDQIRGPVHTNDAIAINGHPTLGRTDKDMIEVGAKSPGWYPISYGSEPEFVGSFVLEAPKLVPPTSNQQLATIALPAYRFVGQVYICLSGSSMNVSTKPGCKGTNMSLPSNGVVYVSNGTCEEEPPYTPFTAVYPEVSGCGNAYVKSTSDYTGQLTIAAQNDIIINGSITRAENSSGMLGLIANNFVRLYHPFCKAGQTTCAATTAQLGRNECGEKNKYGQTIEGQNSSTSLTNPEIDAAILAIEHSIIVDHYDCGDPLGTLKVEGALAQKFRGPVGTGSNTSPSSGYLKNYVYDDRLHFMEPPSFIDPKPAAWVIGRETLE